MTNKLLIPVLAIEAIVLATSLTIAADQIAHTHVEKLGGVNIWGYRGAVLHQKKDHELRIVVAGGDLAFGWGLAASETLAPSIRDLVRRRIDVSGSRERVFTGVTIGARGLPPAGYASWIDRYAYLRPDVICVVLDPIGHVLADPTSLPDRRSRAFAAFGYSPILPLVLQEKGALVHSSLLRLAGRTLDVIDHWIGSRGDRPGGSVPSGADYAASIEAAVGAALRASIAGAVAVVPPEGDAAEVKRALASTLARDTVRLVELGRDPRMLDPGLRLDGFNFSTAGHSVAAESVAPAVYDLIERAERRTR